MEPFQWCLPTFKIWCFKLLCDWRYKDFQTGHFADFEQFKDDNYFVIFEQVKIDSIPSLLLTLDSSQFFTKFGQDMLQKTKNSRTMQNI